MHHPTAPPPPAPAIPDTHTHTHTPNWTDIGVVPRDVKQNDRLGGCRGEGDTARTARLKQGVQAIGIIRCLQKLIPHDLAD